MAPEKEKWTIYRTARNKPYLMVLASGLMLVLSFPPFPFAFLAYIAFVPLLLVMDHTPDRVYEDRFWGFFKAGIDENTEFSLILQGRGNVCNNAEDFTHWRLEVSGAKWPI